MNTENLIVSEPMEMKTFFKKCAILAFAFVMAITFSSCFRLVKKVEPSKNITTKEYDLRGFVGIDASRRIVLHYSVAEEYSIKAQGPENMIDELVCKVGPEKVLALEVYKGESFAVSDDSDKVHVWVTAPHVDTFTAFSDARIECEPLLHEEILNIQTFNGGLFLCDSIQAENVSICAHNSSKVSIGSCLSDIINASAFNSSSIKLKGEVESMMSLEAHNGSSISFEGSATTVNAQAFNGANIQLEGQFKTKTVSEFNGAHITVGNKSFYL